MVLLLAGALGLPAAAQTSWEGRTIEAIEFVPRTQPLDRQTRERLLTLRTGQPFERARLTESIHQLYATGRYFSIDVEASALRGGVALTFFTTTNWYVGSVEVAGVPSPPTAVQIRNVTKLRLGELLTAERLAQAQQQIRALLEENGIYGALIAPERYEHPETQQVDLVFRVKPPPRAAIGQVIFTSGNGRVEPGDAELREIAGWSAGKPYTSERIQEGLDRLEEHFRKQNRLQASARLTGSDYEPDTNQVDLVVMVAPGPVTRIRVEGEEFSAGQLRKYIPVYEEGVVDDDLLAEGARNLRDFLQTKGYFNAEVSYEIERQRPEENVILYRVQRGERFRLVDIQVSGYNFFDRATITERMLIREKSFQFRRGRFSQSLLERDIDEIEELYRSNGFRDIRVEPEVVQDYLDKQGDLAVMIRIHESEPTLVEELALRGVEHLSEQYFRNRLASAPGQPFSEINVATDRDLILAEYFDAGYQDAQFDWTVRPLDDPHRVALEFEVREGEPVTTGNTIVAGLNFTEPDLVDEQIQLVPGEPLSQGAMFETQRRLYDLGIFSKVDVALQNPDGEEREKDVLFQIEEARRWTLRYGGGAEFARIGGNTADVTSPVGDASFSPRFTLELTRLNVRGIGHTMSFRSRLSNLQQRALFTYEAPRWTGSDKWHMTVSGLWDTSRNVRTFTGSRLEGAVQFQHRLSKPSTALYRYTYRRTTIDQNTLQITPLLIPLAAQPVRAGLVSGTYIQDRRDDPTDSTRGSYNTVDISIASGVLGSEPDFFRVLGQNSTYHRLGGRVVLARTIQIGSNFPFGTLKDAPGELPVDVPGFLSNPDSRIPLSERYFSGGANSHRGFPFNQAGPRDPTTGFPVGGGAQFLNSVELRFPLIGENIGGVLFHDAGNVFSKPGRISLRSKQRSLDSGEEFPVFEFDYMVHAVGIGLRYRTPIGPVRFDAGYSINPPRFIGFEGTREELLRGVGTRNLQRISHFQFHFSLGQTF